MHTGLRRDARSVSVGLTSTQLVGPNLKRFALLIGAPLTNRVTLSFGGPAVLDQGITLYPLGQPLLLLFDYLGDALHEDVFAITTAGAQTVGFVDVFWM